MYLEPSAPKLPSIRNSFVAEFSRLNRRGSAGGEGKKAKSARFGEDAKGSPSGGTPTRNKMRRMSFGAEQLMLLGESVDEGASARRGASGRRKSSGNVLIGGNASPGACDAPLAMAAPSGAMSVETEGMGTMCARGQGTCG